MLVWYLGLEVSYAATVPGVPNATKGSTTLVHCLVLCWTGDYPPQCETGKTIFNGIYPCRRCKLQGGYVCMYSVTVSNFNCCTVQN